MPHEDQAAPRVPPTMSTSPAAPHSDSPVRPGDVVRLARANEVTLLAEVERRAAQRFHALGRPELAALEPLPESVLRQQVVDGTLWVAVANDVVVGYAATRAMGDLAWLRQVSVVPEHGSRGLGTLLVDEALLWALRDGHRELWIAAVEGAPWNRTFDDRHGFDSRPNAAPALATLRADPAIGRWPLDSLELRRRSLGTDALAAWGWGAGFERRLAAFPAAADGTALARVVLESRGIHDLITAAGPLSARIAGRLKRGQSDTIQPAIGDWVLVRLPERRAEHGLIEAVLERKSKFSRKVAGARTDEQVVAANIDRVFVVMGLDGDFNPRRLERYLITAHRSGAQPVVVLNKSDLAPELDAQIAGARRVAGATPIHVAAAKHDEGLEELRAYLIAGETIALVGSSGAGKSTLLNRLYGETVMQTRKVREADDRGRHTTTHRQLFRLPNGCLLIDNPGIRELQLWDSEEGVEETFADVQALASGCRFRDCEHVAEPGCAVLAAAARGELDAARLASYRAYGAELRALERRQDEAARMAEKQRSRSIHKALKKHKPRGF